MKRGREFLLAVYYVSTIPWRLCLRARLAKRGIAPLSVLLYHRIAEDRATPWTTSRTAFRRHIAWLARHCDILSLGQLVESLRHGRIDSRPAVAITFDDGYAENLRSLADLLLRGISFTYFVTVENVRTGKPFPHDGERGTHFRPNSPSEIRALAEVGVEIGSHGWNHVDLSRLNLRQLVYELEASKKWLEDLTGRPVTSLAIPYGGRHTLTPPVLLTASRVGYKRVCSAFGGYNIPLGQWFHIRRFHGDDSLWRLINRLTVDPRLWRATRRPLPAEQLLSQLSKVAAADMQKPAERLADPPGSVIPFHGGLLKSPEHIFPSPLAEEISSEPLPIRSPWPGNP